MEVTGECSKSSVSGVVGWKLHYSKVKRKGEPVLDLAKCPVLD